MAEHERSYTSGTSELPLLGLTIGDLFDQTAARYPDNEALVCRQQGLRYTLSRAPGRGRSLCPGSHGPRDREGSAGRHLGAEPRRVDHHAVRHEQDRRDPRQHQPELSAERGAVRAPPVRLRVARHRAGVQDVRLYRHDSRAGAGARREPPGPARGRGTARSARRDPARRRPARPACSPGPSCWRRRRRSASRTWRGASASRSSTTRSTSSTRAAPPATRRAPPSAITTS